MQISDRLLVVADRFSDDESTRVLFTNRRLVLLSKICIVFEGLIIAVWVFGHDDLLRLSPDF